MVETRPETNQVIVGASELLSVDRITCSDIVWLANDDQGDVEEAATSAFGASTGERSLGAVDERVLTAQIRAHGTPSVVTSVQRFGEEEEKLELSLALPIRGVAAGQSMVLYRGTRVIAEATIERANRGEGSMAS